MKSKFVNPNGILKLKHPKITDYIFFIVLSDGMGWEHVSISLRKRIGNKEASVERCPTWEEMCFIKDFFWDEEECVMQLHPPKSQYVNNMPYCLHLWKPRGVEIPQPPSIMVGI